MAQSRILVVEDEQLVALDLVKHLSEMGYAVVTASSGQHALDEANRFQPSIALVDIKLPGAIDGIEAARRLRQAFDIPIVYVTAYADDSTLKQASTAEPYGYILKPFQLREIKAAVEMALHRHAMESQRQHQAQRAVRLREEILAIVSHDLRNLLNVILLPAQQLAANKPVCSLEQAIVRGAQRMKRLIGDLLDVASIDAGRLSIERRATPAGELLCQAIESLRPEIAEKSIALDEQLPDPSISVQCDPGRILQVLLNLLGNAIKFTPPQGRITLRLTSGDHLLCFAIADTGPGIAPSEIPLLFERFWHSPRAYRHGAGLGLYIAKGIIEMHGGQIWVDSRLGTGSTFSFTLPRA